MSNMRSTMLRLADRRLAGPLAQGKSLYNGSLVSGRLRSAVLPRRLYSSSASTLAAPPPPPPASGPSFLRRAATFLAIGVAFTTLGFTMTAMPAIDAASGLLTPISDEDTLSLFVPVDPQEQEVEDYINNHWLAREMRAKADFTESRPHLKMPPSYRASSLTGGLLMGPNRVVVPPVSWNEKGGKSMVSISFLGSELCGHPGIVHGGLLATILDEGMARCCWDALPYRVAMTANLNVNYRAPAPAGSYIALRATTTKVEGRKAWVEARIETLVGEGETPVVLADATALFVSPKQAATMAKVFPAS